MADSLVVQHSTAAANLYAILRNSDGAVWNGSAFVTYATADLATYDLPMTEQGTASRFYAVAMPSVTAGIYSVVVFVRAGGSPAETDAPIASGDVGWTGTLFSALTLTPTQSAKLASNADAVVLVVIGTGSTTTSIVLDPSTGINGAAPPAQNDSFNGRVLIIKSGALLHQATTVSDYVGSTGVLTVTALTGAPIAGVTAILV